MLKQLIIVAFFNFYIATLLPSYAAIKEVLIYPEHRLKDSSIIQKPIDLVFYFQGANCESTLFLEPFSSGGLDLLKTGKFYRKDLLFFSFDHSPKFQWSFPETTREVIEYTYQKI